MVARDADDLLVVVLGVDDDGFDVRRVEAGRKQSLPRLRDDFLAPCSLFVALDDVEQREHAVGALTEELDELWEVFELRDDRQGDENAVDTLGRGRIELRDTVLLDGDLVDRRRAILAEHEPRADRRARLPEWGGDRLELLGRLGFELFAGRAAGGLFGQVVVAEHHDIQRRQIRNQLGGDRLGVRKLDGNENGVDHTRC